MASGLDDLEYLSPDFDLSSLTVPRLRAILVRHDISYPSSAKKAQLISIFEKEVLPKAKKLLRDRDLVRRTSAGITDMSSQSNFEANGDEDEIDDRESMPPPPTPSTVGSRRGRSRPSTRASTADTEDSTLLQATPRRRGRPSRSTRASEADTADENLATPVITQETPQPRSTARKTRRSEALPSYDGHVEHTPSVKTDSRAGSVFSDENPFQSGSSPTSHEQTPRTRTISRERKRKSTPRVSGDSTLLAEHRGKRDSTRPIKIKQEEDAITPRKSTFEFSVSRLRTATPQSEDESESEAGEEFTPDEQLALETANAQSRSVARHRQSEISWRLPTLVLALLLSGFGAWWRQEKFEIGFCGVGKPRWSLADTNVPEWANVLEPQCEPCPPHAFCFDNLKIECENGFVRQYHPLSINGWLPIPPQCEVDNAKSDRIIAVANKAVQELRGQRAKYECGDADGAKTPFVSEVDLKKAVEHQRHGKSRVKMSDAEFDDLWASAMGELVSREEITTSEGASSRAFASNSLAKLPIICAFRRHLRLSLIAYRLPILLLVLTIAGLAYIRAEFIARRADIARVPELVGTTLDRLSTQAALHRRGEAPEPWIAIGQLRDDVLRSELRGNRRERLWKRVQAVVEGNANVRAAVRESRSGDVARAWEWVGSSLGSHLDSVRRESGRVRFSVSPGDETSPAGNEDMSTLRSPRESRKWDEGRPIY
ncbi:sister chromatid separation protein (Src1), putative [Talaromyces stipitatus ATCC 10500]|uniref:Sister chromatid separation protein (Src1), putative n=1 Tax=Talaromyces stipitatus (strain ATCC 10500 / CBS 375.48 / QM 6759 / NRRL 1006) TaxID=441959 RepID=B8M319_TALSN|nr:sister chromatid separation protein (Src1), putative [Talaromyces stipitatus ATCC 10500]EED21995.1 sister chromatid separation protein (Src1), putative [Talaromyces stipitatus ATCC 10500]